MENINGMYSIKEIYRIGRGPSSSHTMGPSRACEIMLKEYPDADNFHIEQLFGVLFTVLTLLYTPFYCSFAEKSAHLSTKTMCAFFNEINPLWDL